MRPCNSAFDRNIQNYTNESELLVLDMIIWYHITVCKQMIINIKSKLKKMLWNMENKIMIVIKHLEIKFWHKIIHKQMPFKKQTK